MNKFPTFPEIKETVFGDPKNAKFTEADAELNTRLLRAAREVVQPECEHVDGAPRFYTKNKWLVRIWDEHCIETTPHYVLEFGYGLAGRFDEYAKDIEAKASSELMVCKAKVGYCDSQSVVEIMTIEQAPGYFHVEALGDFDRETLKYLVGILIGTYIKGLKKLFPTYDIPCEDSVRMQIF